MNGAPPLAYDTLSARGPLLKQALCMFAEITSKSLFPTPFVIASLSQDEAAGINQSLRETIIAREQASPGVAISNRGGWQSDDKILEWAGPHFSLFYARSPN